MSWPPVSAKCSEIFTWYKNSHLCTPQNEERIFNWLESNKNKDRREFVKWLMKESATEEFALKVWKCLLEHKRLSDIFVANKTEALVEAKLLDPEEADEYDSVTKASIRW